MRKTKKECSECKAWREVIVLLIENLPHPTKSLVCAQLATAPKIWRKLTDADKAQVKLIQAMADL